MKNVKLIKRTLTIFVAVATIFWSIGVPFIPMTPIVKADDPPMQSFWINSISPMGGGADTDFSGTIYFSGPVNANTVSYSNANASSSSVLLLTGRYDNYTYFDTYMQNNPDLLHLPDYDVETLTVTVNANDSSRLDLDLSTGALDAGTTYTILVKNVCSAGNIAQGENYWQNCAMRFETFTTAGGSGTGVALSLATQAVNLCNGTLSYFVGEANRPLYIFNAYANDSRTLNQIKLYTNGDPSNIIQIVKVYRDRTSYTNSNANWTLESGIDTLLASNSTWTDEGDGVYSNTLTFSPVYTLPTTDPNGNFGFIAIDIASGATGTTSAPVFQAGSFTFGSDTNSTLLTAMNTAISNLTCASPVINITSADNQQSPYLQNLTSTSPLNPNESSVVLGIDFWNAEGGILESVTVDVIVPSGSGFDPQYGLASLAVNSAGAGINIYQDNKADSQNRGTYDNNDTRLQLTSAPTWTALSGTSKRTTLTMNNIVSLPTNNSSNSAGADFFIVIKTSTSPAAGSSFQVRVPINGFVTGFPTSNYDSSTINIQSSGPMGGGASHVLISEIQTAGGETTDEFVELYNPTNAAFNLANYSIQYRNASTGAFAKQNFAATNTIAAYGFFLISPSTYDGATAHDLDNAAFNLDETGGTVFLINNQTILTTGTEATIVDKVAWGTGNNLSAEGEAATAPSANGSIERKSCSESSATDMAENGMDENMGNMADYGNNFMDFVEQTTAVPQNTASTVENPMQNMQGGAGSPVVINEIYYYPASTASSWVEIFNRTASNQTLTNWTITYRSNSTSTAIYTFPSFTLAANTYTTIWWNQGGTDTLTDLYTANGTENGTNVTVDMSTLAGDLLLKDSSNNLKDYVQYGQVDQPNESTAATGGQWVEDNVVPSVLRGQSIGRNGTLGDDTNRSTDWQTFSSPTEGTANSGGDSFAPDPVINVVLIDNDTTNFGLTGADVTVTWIPNQTIDPTFEKYLIYLLPASTALNVTNHIPYSEIYSGQTTQSFTGMSGMTRDSRNPGVNLAAGSYRAYVVAQDRAGNRSSAAASPAYTLDAEDEGDVGADTQRPFIMHMGVWQAKAGANIVLLVRINDDRASGTIDVAGDDHTDGNGTGAQVVWQATTTEAAIDMTTNTTTTDCEAIEGDYVKCTIASANAVEGRVVAYYLKASDAANNLSMMSASASADTSTYVNNTAYENAVKQNPFIIDILAATQYTDDGTVVDLSGTVYQSNGSVLQGAYVYIEGSAIGAVQTNSSGVFSFADNTVMAGSWPTAIFKDGYMDMYGSAFKGESGLTYYLSVGEMYMSSGGTTGGYMDMPTVIYTNPNDGMMGVPIENFTMTIGFSKSMNGNTIIDNDAANANSNIYLTTNGQDRVGGSVSYATSTNAATFTVTSGTNLVAGTQYALVITTNVTDQMGNPLSGGWRADGAFEITFNTMMDNSNMWGTGWQDYAIEGGAHYGETMVGGGQYFGGMDFSNYGQGGMMMPPYVKGTTPQPGSSGISRNTSITIEFSEPMNSSTINSNTIILYPIANQSAWTPGTAVTATVSLDSATQKIVTLDTANNLDLNTVNGGWYILKVMGNVQSSAGVWLGNPQNCGSENPSTCLASQSSYEMSFQLNTNANTASDSTAPRVLGTYPNNNDGITSGTLAVDVGVPAIEISFSEAMNPSTVDLQNITLASGSRSVSGKVTYNSTDFSARFIPASALLANTRYTLTVTTTVQDLAGNALDQDSSTSGNQANTITFKTGSADSTGPTVLYANSDDYTMAISYSEAVNTAKQTDTSRWSTSALNPANYYVKTLNSQGSGIAPYATATVLSNSSGLTFSYDEPTNTIMIKGFSFFSSSPHPTDLQVFVDNLTDRSNNPIQDTTGREVSGNNAAQCPIQSSANTYGMLGPGGPGMNMMGPMGGGGPMGGPASGTGGGCNGPCMDMGMMGMMKAGAWPMNMMAGQTSMYMVSIPTTKSIPAGGSIVLTFPLGANVTNAALDPYSPMNNDINGWNVGAITITSLTANASARTVTLVTAGAATQANDFLNIDLKSIVNPSRAKEFGTDGYTVDMKTFNASGAMLETITSMPFYIQEGGTNTISGTITATAAANNGTTTIYLGSPMTGPMETTSSVFSNGTATYSFTNLPDGEFHIFTEPVMTIGSGTYYGNQMPEPIWLSGSNATKNITLEAEGSSGTKVTVHLIGNFSTDSTADNVDIFANSPSGYRVKTVSGAGTQDGTTDHDLYLSNGHWMIGIGKAMPKGVMTGPVSMPDWMAPQMIDVEVNSGATPAVRENSVTANDATIVFDISSQGSYSIIGIITDGVPTSTYTLGTPIADVEIHAYQPYGGYGGANTKSKTDGTFTLKIPVLGTYKVGAYKPGLPESKEKTVDVRSDGNYLNGTLLTAVAGANPFVLKMKKPAYTISGKVLNASGKAVAYAPVWAYKPNDYGHANTMTDTTGNYILYVDNGTWRIEADASGVGWLQYSLPVTINGASQSNINLRPDTNLNWKTISGTVTIDSSAQTYMPIRAVAYDASGYYLGREYSAMTDSNGQYEISVPGTSAADSYNYYRVDMWTYNYGEVELSTDAVANSPANIKVNNQNQTNANITIGEDALKTTTFTFTNGSDYSGVEGFIRIDGVSFDANNVPSPTNYHKSKRVSDLAGPNPTVKLQAGDYFIFVDVPGYGGYAPTSSSAAFDSTKGCITVDGTNDAVTIVLPDLDSADEIITISGTISGPDVGERDAWVWVSNPTTGFHAGTNAASSTGAYSMTVPILSSGRYRIGAELPGFISAQTVSNNGTANATNVNFTLTAAAQTITGSIFADSDNDNTLDPGEAVPNGWVRAENTTTGAMAHAPVDGIGAYELAVTDGQWKVYGVADGYTESQYRVNNVPTTITVSGDSPTGRNIKLTANSNWTSKSKSKPITPASGGTIDDTAQSTTTLKLAGTGVKMTLPPNALGSSNSAGNVSVVETAAVADTNSMSVFASQGKSITATDNSGQPITQADNYFNMEMVLYKADVDEEDANVIDNSKLKTMDINYWDDTLNEWNEIPTTKKAYYKVASTDTDWTLYSGTTTASGYVSSYDRFIDDALVNETFVADTDYVDFKLVFVASTNHMTVFALGTSPDGVRPAAPTSLAQTSGVGTSVGLSWTAPSLNADNTTLTDLYGYAVYRSTDGTTYTQISTSAILAGTTTYTDSTTLTWTSYYYRVTAGDDDNLESAYSTALHVCSTNSVSHGSVAADCTITCNSGYSQSGHTCIAVTTSSGGGGGIFWTILQQQEEAAQEAAELTTSQEESLVIKVEEPTEVSFTDLMRKTTFTLVEMVSDAATIVLNKVNDIVSAVGLARSIDSEVQGQIIANKISGFGQAVATIKTAMTNFITYGTPSTVRLGEGERAGVVNSYKAAFKKLPETQDEWNDIVKIANGRWPAAANSEREDWASKVFKQVYLRDSVRTNSHDDAAVVVIAYGLRPAQRNLDSERAAIKHFRAIFGHQPQDAEDWDTVRAIAYSGATR